MKRSITDFFGSSPTKKAKVAEDQAVGVTHTGAPASPAKVLPQAVPKTVRAPVPLSSSNDLTDAEAQMIETNRKKALARQLLQRIIEPSWKEALEPGTLREKDRIRVDATLFDLSHSSTRCLSLHSRFFADLFLAFI